MSNKQLITVGTKITYEQRDKLKLTTQKRGFKNIAEFLKYLVIQEIEGVD